MKKRRKSAKQHTPPGDPFDLWLGMVGTLVIEPMLVAAMRPSGPYPLLTVNGEQGSAKSTLCRMVRALIDPNQAPLRSEPRDARDLMIAATNGWILAFDNPGRVQPWLSDALCRLATGGGFATRELYTDADEKIFDAMRPVVLNGIDQIATRSDLLDRCVNLTLPTIPEARRRTESELWAAFEQARPRTLGALPEAVSAALRTAGTVHFEEAADTNKHPGEMKLAESAHGPPFNQQGDILTKDTSLARVNQAPIVAFPPAVPDRAPSARRSPRGNTNRKVTP